MTTTTWFVLRKTGVAKSFVQRMLAEKISTPFALDHAEVDLGRGTLRLTDLRIDHPVDKNRPLMQAKDVQVSVTTNPLGKVGRVDKIVLRGVRIDDLQVSGPHALRFDEIFKVPASDADTDTYPAVVIEDASIGIRFADNAAPLQFEDVDLELLPLDGGGSEMVLRGSMSTVLGTRVSVTGQGDIGKQRFRVLAKAESLPLSPSAVKPFSAHIADALAAADVGGHVTLAQLWIESGDGGGELSGGFQVDADAISFCAPQFARRVEGSASIRGLLADEGSVSLSLLSQDDRGTIKLQGSVQRLLTSTPEASLTLDLAGLTIDDELLRGLMAQPQAAPVVAAFSPGATGSVDADARVVIGTDGVKVDVDATLRGMSVSFLGFPGDAECVSFPYPLHDLGGDIHIRADTIVFDGLKAADAHGGSVSVSGRIPFDPGAPGGQVTIAGSQIAFNDDLRAALQSIAPKSVQQYDDCAPVGRADVEVRVADFRADAPPDFHVRIEPRAAVVTHAIFPYRCEDVTGTVDIDRRGVVFDLRGARLGKAILARGRFEIPPLTLEGAGLTSQLWLHADELHADDDLRQALAVLSPPSAELWPILTPTGTFGCEVTTWQAAGDPTMHFDVRVDVLDGKVCARAFPLPIERVRGPIFVHGDGDKRRVDVHLLAGSVRQAPDAEPADVLVSGSVRREGEAMDLDLTTITRGLKLRPELRDVLDRAGVLSAAAWDALHPTGAVDVIARHQMPSTSANLRNHVRLQLDNAGISTPWLPAPVTRLVGEIIAIDGRASASEVRGLLGASPIVVRNGEVWHTDNASHVRGSISADDFPLNDDLARLFGASPLRAAYLNRQIRGRANVTALEIECMIPDADDSGPSANFELRASGQLSLRDSAFTLAVPIEHVDGILTVRECVVTPDVGKIAGTLANVSMQVLGRPVHDLSSTFAANADEIVLGDVSLRLHGGRVVGETGTPSLRYLTAGEGTLAANLSWQGVRLSELASPGNRGGAGITGNLSGRLVLEQLPGTRLIDAVGSGAVHITGGRLGDVPLFRSIYAILRRQPQFTSADAEYTFGARRITIDEMTLGSQIFEVHGKGQVSMDGYVDMTIELPDLFGDAADFLILPEILHNAVAQVLEFKLHGYLRNPAITPVTLFQGSPARRELGPIPAPLAEVPRKRF